MPTSPACPPIVLDRTPTTGLRINEKPRKKGVPMDGKKTGLHGKRAPRLKEQKYVFKGVRMPPEMAAEFERKAADAGVSFNRYILEHCLQPHSDAEPEQP